ncbi:PI-PLC X domain-containing protein 3 [Dermatophagoides pteronyssinus]|uniref:PI-PLC X domain-containing protein 3 n=1 Tax=Dermatophagoides pteronyssinus TaxID=6956 RepID=UPI003F681946
MVQIWFKKSSSNLSSQPINTDWMSKLSDQQKRQPISKLIIPGSHDSGAYKLSTELGIAIDRPGLNQFYINKFSFITYPIIYRYSQTQYQNIYEQLKSGIRYLDLRISLNPLDDEFYITHNFYGPSLLIVLFQIKRFIENYPNEIIIIDIQHTYNIDTDDKFNRLIDIFNIIFHDQMFLPTSNDEFQMPSINDMINNRQPIMVIYRGNYPNRQQETNEKKIPKFFLPNSIIYSPWPDTRCPLMLEKFIDNILSTKINPNRLFVMQTVLTPNNLFVIINFWSSLRRLSEPIGKIIWNLFGFQEQNSKNQDQDDDQQQQRCKKLDKINIVMYDYIDRQWKKDGIFLIDQIIAANFFKQPDQKSFDNNHSIVMKKIN